MMTWSVGESALERGLCFRRKKGRKKRRGEGRREEEEEGSEGGVTPGQSTGS